MEPCISKVDKPGIQADRLLCLLKPLANRQFESSTNATTYREAGARLQVARPNDIHNSENA